MKYSFKVNELNECYNVYVVVEILNNFLLYRYRTPLND